MDARRRDRSVPAGEIISSPANNVIKLIRSLRQRSSREAERAFLVEGFRAVADALSTGAEPLVLAVRESQRDRAVEWLGDNPAALRTIRLVDDALLDRVSETVTPQGIIGVFPFPELPIVERPDPLFLIVDQVRDPGNLGTLIRTAAAAGVSAIYLTPATVDPFNLKVVRSAVGAHFRIPIRWLSDDARSDIEQGCPTRVIADAGASTAYDALEWTGPAALIIGSEAHGAGTSGEALATGSISIPLASGVESLNAAAAGAVILFEAARQRRMHRAP